MTRVVATSIKQSLRAYHSTGVKAATASAREQPWKAFWPPKKEDYSAEQQTKMPWLTWKPDPNRPDDKPWRQWMLAEQNTVVRRGSSW